MAVLEPAGSGDQRTTSPAVEYARRLYDDVLEWYHSADTKAHVVLGVDGAFLAFVAAAVFQKPGDVSSVTRQFSPLTWQLLGAMAVTLVASIASAIYCLWSRVYFRPGRLVKKILKASSERGPAALYPPDVMWFFQFIPELDAEKFRTTLAGVGTPFEIDVLASQVMKLSVNVRQKHMAANFGFALTVITLLLFAAAAGEYLMTVRTPP